MPYQQQLQQNLNQIAQICQQLSQNEQLNASKLEQMVQAERTATQQLQQCVQLCNQAVQQMSGQFAGQYNQYGTTAGTGAGTYGNWSNRPVNTSNAFFGGQGGQFSNFETSKELQPTGQSAFNTNKDLGQ